MATQLILNPENQPVFFEALEKLGTPGALALAQMAKEFTEETDVTRIYRKAAQLDAYEDVQVDHTAAVSAAEEGAWVRGARIFQAGGWSWWLTMAGSNMDKNQTKCILCCQLGTQAV
jgi:hypothetical protein